MKKTLDDLSAMQGIHASFLFSEDGGLVEFSAPAVYDRELLAQASSTLARACESMAVQHADWEMLVSCFSDGKLLLTKLDSHVIGVIADANVNFPFLNVALRVAKKKLSRKLQDCMSSSIVAQSPSGRSSGPAFSGESSSQIRSVESGIHPMGLASSVNQVERPSGPFPTEGMSSGMFWSGMGGSGMQSSAVMVADEASFKLLTRVGSALAGAVGPMAKVFIKEAVRKVCPSMPFSTRNLNALLTELDTHIQDPDERQDFRSKIQ